MRNNKSQAILWPILLGIAVGLLIGGLFPPAGRAIAFIGELFIRSLLMIVVPLVIVSLVVGITSLGDLRQIGSIGKKTIAYYLSTTAIAVLVGLILVNTIQPGYADTAAQQIALRGGEELADVSYRIEDERITLDNANFQKAYDERYVVILLEREQIRARVEGLSSSTSLMVSEWTDAAGESVIPPPSGVGVRVDLGIAQKVKGKEGSILTVLREMIVGLVPRNLFQAMADNDVLPLIVFSLIFGGVLTILGERARPVIALFEGLDAAMMKIVHLLMRAAPYGMGALIAGRLGEAGGFSGFVPELLQLSKYSVTVLLGLLIHGVGILALLFYFVGKRTARKYSVNMVPALATAFATASSSATLPVTLECVTEKNGVSERTASFVLPLGATINMDGTALYEAVSAVFIAQIYGIELTPVQTIIVFFTSTLGAIGAAGIPQAGLVTMVVVLRAANLPIEGISLILVVDWFLDRCRTTINVWGDAIGAAIVEKLTVPHDGKDLDGKGNLQQSLPLETKR